MEEPSLALVAAIAAVVASGVGGFFALGGVIVQDRLAARRRQHEAALDARREADRRKVERRLAIITDTLQATHDIYNLIFAWAFGHDKAQLKEARFAASPGRNPRADWLYVDNDDAMIAMFEVTREIVAAGQGAADPDTHSAELLLAYNRVGNSLIRQEDRLHDGADELPVLGDDGQDAFMRWIQLVEHMRVVS